MYDTAWLVVHPKPFLWPLLGPTRDLGRSAERPGRQSGGSP